MRMLRSFSLAMLFVLSFVAVSHATVLTFEEVSTTNYTLLSSEYGFNWTNMYVTYSPSRPTSGYRNGAVSGNNVAFNGFGEDATTVTAGSDFDFSGAYLTGAWNDSLMVQVQGWDDGALMYDMTVTTSAYSAQYFSFDFLSIDTLVFHSYGGTPVSAWASSGEGTHFVMDNFTFNESAVPEPATMLLLGTGLLGLVGLSRRREA